MKASAAHKAAIGRLGLRFPAARDQDPQQRRERLEMLADDVADIPSDMIERACTAAAKAGRFLPSAAEIREQAQRLLSDQGASDGWDPQAEACRRYNLKMIQEDKSFRAYVRDGQVQTLLIGTPGERRRCDGAGSVIVPYWSEQDRDWVYPR